MGKSNLMDVKFDSEPVYGDNDKYTKTKIKIDKDKVNTNFQGKKVPEENASYKCVSLIMLDSVIKASQEASSSNTFGRVKVWNKKDQNEEPY